MLVRTCGALLLLGSGIACGHRQLPPAPARWVRVAQPATRRQAETYPLHGTVVPEGGGQGLSFLVAGRVSVVRFREGERVRKGQVLAELEPTSYAAALEAAAAQTRSAQAAALRAQDELRRMTLIYERKSLAENDYLKFRLADQAAREQLLQAQANEKAARKNFADTRLLAPNDGVVTRRALEPGLTVAAGQPAFELSRLDPVEIQVGVPETLVNELRIGQKAEVRVAALPGVVRGGSLRILNAAVDPASRTYMARVAVPNRDGRLRLGMVAEVRIQGDRQELRCLVPQEAVVRDPQGVPQVFEYRPGEGRVLARRVVLGMLDGQQVELQSGVEASCFIVVAGQHALRDGEAVQVESSRAGAQGGAR